MKKVNLWKTLFLSALAVAAFTGCSDDDSDEGGGMPSITVNGQSTTTLSIGLAGGTTEAVTIESSGDWTMTVTGENGADASACTPSLSSGSKGTKTVTFDLTEAATPRTYTVKVTTSGTIPGIGVATDVSATIKIEQTDAFVPTDEPLFYEDCGTTGADSKPKVYSYEGWSRKGSLSQTGVTYATSSTTSVRTGTGSYLPTADEKSAVSGPNWIYIGYADQDFEIQNINVGTATDFTFTFTAQLQKGYDDGPEFETNLSSSIIKLKVSTDGLSYNEVPFTTKQVATGGSWILCSSEFKLPAGVQTSTISVRLSDFAQQDGYQFRVDDFKLYEGGNGDALPAPATPTTATIGEITEAGLFAVKDATVIIRSDEGCIIADATGAMMIYGSNELAVGDKINISGSVTIYQSSNVPQFNLSTSGTEVETVSKGNSWTYDNFTEYSVEDIRSYFNNIKCLPVQIAGTIVEDSGHYNVVFDGVSDVQGSVEYYTPEASVLNVPVVIKGYATGKSTYNNITRIKIFPYSIEVSSSTPYITATAPASFKAEGETIKVSYTAGNLGSNKVFAKLENNEAGQFSVGEVADGKVSVTAKANEGAACEATLVLYVAASEGGEIIAQTSVALKQASATVAAYTMITKAADVKAGKGYLAGLVNNQYQTWTGKMDSNHCVTTAYTYDAGSGAFSPVSAEAAEIELVAVDGVAGAYYIKCGNQYLTVSKAGKSCLTLTDTAGNNYWTFEDAVDGVKGIANAYASWLLTSATAGSNNIRSYSTSATTKTGVIFFLEK